MTQTKESHIKFILIL